MIDITKNIRAVQNDISILVQRYHRTPNSVTLVAVSKFQPISALQIACQAGLTDFAENYVQEALPKISALGQEKITWHYIGRIQSNKTRQIAEHFYWVHTIDRLEIAQKLNDARPLNLPPLNVCIQVNLASMSKKGGISLSALSDLAHTISKLPRLHLRGLMTIPDFHNGLTQQQSPYEQLAEARTLLDHEGLPLDTLSMGMSGDLEAAISMGSTIVRVGTAIFGARPTQGVK
ncbi:MAG: YggS family pyridoxal phosphate-dependent enzyme [Gammaproteobacteria bacterium]